MSISLPQRIRLDSAVLLDKMIMHLNTNVQLPMITVYRCEPDAQIKPFALKTADHELEALPPGEGRPALSDARNSDLKLFYFVPIRAVAANRRVALG